MSEIGLTPDDLKRWHEESIAKGDTFETKGIGRQAALDYLNSDEGALYWWRVNQGALPNTPSTTITERAVGQLMSARELPRMESIETGEPLIKFVAGDLRPTPYSSFWALESHANAAIAEGRNISDYFGLPIGSEAPRYGMYRMTSEVPTQIFINTVAPTSELGGLVTKGGGAEQVLIPNRKLFHEPVYIKSVENIPSITAEAGRSTLSSGMVRSVAILGAVAVATDAYTTAEKYRALSAQGNEFGADALLRRYEGRTAGGFLGSIATGAAYGFVGGSETGPGAFLTGAAGGVIGAFAGEEIAKAINEHKLNHQTGTDGVTYAHENGQWSRTQHHLDLESSGPANPYNAPNYTLTTTPAPNDQIQALEYKRMTAVTALALANPATQDTKHIDLDGIHWHATRDGWAQQVEIPGAPNAYGIPSPISVDKPADVKTSEVLNQVAANRQFNNDHYAGKVANAYVMDYYGKGWAADGALPEVVTKPLDLASEQHIKDPVTGHVWNSIAEGQFSLEDDRSVGRVFIRETGQASGDELNRLSLLQQSAMQSNADYGKKLIAQKFADSDIAQHPERTGHADDMLPATTEPRLHDNASPNPSLPSESTAGSMAVPPITPNSSGRQMFNALMTATLNMDIDAMRSVSNNYLQSPQGQAWLEHGQQLNQQQAVVQQQAAMDAQQQSQVAAQGPMR